MSKKNRKPFNLEAALNGAKLVTRDGRRVEKFVKWTDSSESRFQYLASIINKSGKVRTFTLNENGMFMSYENHDLDLFIVE